MSFRNKSLGKEDRKVLQNQLEVEYRDILEKRNIQIMEQESNKIEVENINELYKWIKNENSTTLNNTKVEGNKEAEDLFAFFKFYFKIFVYITKITHFAF